jgi:hypothetical protein
MKAIDQPQENLSCVDHMLDTHTGLEIYSPALLLELIHFHEQ